MYKYGRVQVRIRLVEMRLQLRPWRHLQILKILP